MRTVRPGCTFALRWEFAIALLTTVDFFFMPYQVAVEATEIARVGERAAHDFVANPLSWPHVIFYIVSIIDGAMIADLVFQTGQRVLVGLGFAETKVDRLLATLQGQQQSGAPVEWDAIAERAVMNGSLLQSPAVLKFLKRGALARFLLTVPLWIAGLTGASHKIFTICHFLRLYRARDLFNYFLKQQAEFAVDVKYVALFKFVTVILATGHWLGCLFYVLAAESHFSDEQFATSWVVGWVRDTFLLFSWRTASQTYQYAVRLPAHGVTGMQAGWHGSCAVEATPGATVGPPIAALLLQVMLFKGFSILTNLGYESSVPERAEEMIVSVIAQNVKVIIDAYILGTLFHYIVKQDPQLEALRSRMAALSNYCKQRSLSADLQRRMADYLRFQQKYTGSHLQMSMSVRHSPSVLLSLVYVSGSAVDHDNMSGSAVDHDNIAIPGARGG